MSKKLFYSKTILITCILLSHFVDAAPVTRVVNSTSNDPNNIGTLPYWLLNANSGDIIDCSSIAGQSISLTSSLPAITQNLTINGAGITINGVNSYQAFQVASGNVTIDNVKIKNAISKGGDGGDGYSGGGGGVGGGGALYVHGGTSVTLSASSLTNNTAQGGNGGSADSNGNAGGGGGGGFGGGNGGDCMFLVSTGGGGGGHSNGGNGGSNVSLNGVNGVYFGGGGGGAGINSVAPGGSGGNASPGGIFLGGSQSAGNGGGGAGDSENGGSATGSGGVGIPGDGGNGIGIDLLFGGGGGGGAASETGYGGGAGIGAGGGGGGSMGPGGIGGILGGGGAGALGNGGAGGFGAGGGGAFTGGIGGGGFNAGGGNGGSDLSDVAGGGGGSGLGGAIFIQSNANLTIVDAEQISGNTVIAGLGGSSTNSADPNYIPAGNGAALGYDIFVRESGSITFDLSNTLTIATPIEGDQTSGPNTPGGLRKTGEGILKLNGSNTYSGITTVDSGILNINGSVIGNAIVNTGAILSGNATVLGNITNSGTLAPGNSIGTINTTNLVLNPSSILEIEIASNNTNDLIAATGTAQINGTLEVIPLPGNYQTAQSYTIVTADGGRTGSFTKVESSKPTLLKVTYNPKNVVLEALPIADISLDSNAASAASCYLADGFITGSDIEIVNAALLTLDPAAINNSFNQMQPSQFSALGWSQIENALLVRSGYYRHLENLNPSCDCCNDPHVWVEAIGAWQKQNTHGQQFGYNDWTGGATLGLDAIYCNEFRIGAAASYTYSRLNWKKSAGHADINSYYGGFYTNWTNQYGYINATLLGSYSHYRTDRHLHFATIDRQAKATHNSWEGLAGLEAGLNVCWDECMEITPFARVDYIHLSQQAFTENGADSLDLNVRRHQDQIVQSELGVIWTGRYAYQTMCTPGTLVPRVKLSFINDAPINNRHLNASFVDSNCNFSVKGLCFSRNLGAVSLGLTYLNCNETLSLNVQYDGQFGNDYFNQSANIALDFKF